jgi:hypothetical protein
MVCKRCKRFETDEMVERRKNEQIKSIRNSLYGSVRMTGIADPPGRIAV